MQRTDSEPHHGVWFRHESPYELSTLRPLTYAELARVRPDYDVKARQRTEDAYRVLIPQSRGVSFLYATVVGFNRMEPPDEYPGFTYYFQLTSAEINHCLFGIVDQQEWMPMQPGRAGMVRALGIWKSHTSAFRSYEEDGLGLVDPRVEVVIPFSVTPSLYYPQIEDR